MAALQEEKNSLMSENEIMNDRLEQLDDSADDPNTMVAKKYFHAQLQLEQLQEENFRYEMIFLSLSLDMSNISGEFRVCFQGFPSQFLL